MGAYPCLFGVACCTKDTAKACIATMKYDGTACKPCRTKFGGELDPRYKRDNDATNEKRRRNGKAKEYNDANNEKLRLNGKKKEHNDAYSDALAAAHREEQRRRHDLFNDTPLFTPAEQKATAKLVMASEIVKTPEGTWISLKVRCASVSWLGCAPNRVYLARRLRARGRTARYTSGAPAASWWTSFCGDKIPWNST